MGMTFATLQLWGVEREAAEPLLQPGDLLREQNAPWLGVVPDEEACGDLQRLEKLGKLLTKENGSAAALLFYYYDDDWFLCRVYQGGKVRSGSPRDKEVGYGQTEKISDRSPRSAFGKRCADSDPLYRVYSHVLLFLHLLWCFGALLHPSENV